jgi:Arc/MetJ-type ribon-helix-helix transcriptional regulator
MNVSLPESLKDFIDEQVSRVGYGTSREYGRGARVTGTATDLRRLDADERGPEDATGTSASSRSPGLGQQRVHVDVERRDQRAV